MKHLPELRLTDSLLIACFLGGNEGPSGLLGVLNLNIFLHFTFILSLLL